MVTTSIISVNKLVYEYANYRALDNISFDLPVGSVTALVGPNGAGKTTLMRCLAALDTPFSGQITINGVNTQESPRECHKFLGYLSDHYGLYDDLTALQSLTHIGNIQGLAVERISKRIDELGVLLNYKYFLDRRCSSLSRGQRQKIAIAQALIHDPKILILDEPASGLDPEARIELSSVIRTLSAEGKTIIVSSHILSELQDYSTHILTLSNGRVLDFVNLAPHITEKKIRLKITLQSDWARHAHVLQRFPELSAFEIQGADLFCHYTGEETALPSLVKSLIAADIDLTFITKEQVDLEALYLRQIKKDQ